MKKGITPIISVIILLLITVGLAAAAWTYMGNFFSSLTAKTIEIPTQKCISGASGATNVMIILHNMGTESVSLTNDVTILSNGIPVAAAAFNWCMVNETCASDTLTAVPAGGFGKVIITGCTTPGVAKTCNYDFVVASRTQSASVYCTG
ncbi:MAG: archaellin/type IV pilin N-terminal domain-containing protein [Candidatus Aenigmatarchaeota archaeon]